MRMAITMFDAVAGRAAVIGGNACLPRMKMTICRCWFRDGIRHFAEITAEPHLIIEQQELDFIADNIVRTLNS